MTAIPIRDISMYIQTLGEGYPLCLMHGGPGADHSTLLSLRPLADHFTLVYYDHRCNGRSDGAGVETMTWENLTADADALRQALGFERWAVLGHSFGVMVALEYALRYPDSLSRLVLMDTCGESSWVQQNAIEILTQRGYSPAAVQAARRFFTGQLTPNEFLPLMMKFGKAYYYRPNILKVLTSGTKVKTRPEAQIFAFSRLLPGWSVMDRLGEIQVPVLVLAGRHDFEFPPEHQAILADRLPDARLVIIELAGHNAVDERPEEVVSAIRRFLDIDA
jgi:proline iminopeptidase